MSSLTPREVQLRLMEHLEEKFGGQEFCVGYKDLADEVGEDYRRIISGMTELIRKGYLERVKGGKGRTPVLRIAVFEDSRDGADKVSKEDIRGLRTTQERDIEIFNFEDQTTRVIYDEEHGYVVPLPDIANAVGVNKAGFYKLIERNREIFEPYIVERKPSDQRKVKALTRKGIIAYLQKAETRNMPAETKERIIQFQRWATEKLDTLLAEGKVEMDSEEHEAVMNTFQQLSGLSDENLQKIMSQLMERSFEAIQGVIQEEAARLVNYTKGLMEENYNGTVSELKEKIQRKDEQLEQSEKEINYLQKKKDQLHEEKLRLTEELRNRRRLGEKE